MRAPASVIGALFACLLVSQSSSSAEITINCCRVTNPPLWLTPLRITKVASRIEEKLNWSIRRISIQYHQSSSTFNAQTNLNFRTRAFFLPARQIMHLSPELSADAFDSVFGHELVHVIFSQKFKKAIPDWLEEGLANYIGAERQVEYRWLSTQTIPNVTSLVHPKSDVSGHKMHYQLSTATAEMIANKCSMNDLLMLATGKKLTSYLATFCKISDVNLAVKKWIAEKTKS